MPAILIVTGDVRFVRLMPPVRRSQRQPQRAEWRRALTARLPRTGMINSFRVLACARGSGTTQPGPLLHSQDRLGSAQSPNFRFRPEQSFRLSPGSQCVRTGTESGQ